MFDHFSESTRRIIFWSRSEAGRLKFEKIETQHLLLGFVLEDQDQSRSNLTAKRSFLDSETAAKLKTGLSWSGTLESPQPSYGDMPLSQESKAALKAAIEYANGLIVSPLHLVLGVIDHGGSQTMQCLVDCGVNRAQVEQAAHH